MVILFLCFIRAFTSICYSADGEYIIAAGHSKYVCIYHIAEGILVKKFEITQNRSLDAVDVSVTAFEAPISLGWVSLMFYFWDLGFHQPQKDD